MHRSFSAGASTSKPVSNAAATVSIGSGGGDTQGMIAAQSNGTQSTIDQQSGVPQANIDAQGNGSEATINAQNAGQQATVATQGSGPFVTSGQTRTEGTYEPGGGATARGADVCADLGRVEQSSPIPVQSVADLKAMVTGKHYKLVVDLDLSSQGSWHPLSSGYQLVLDGQGHTISGMVLDNSSLSACNYYPGCGLFGQVTCSIIRNVIMQRPRIDLSPPHFYWAGVMAGSASNSLFQNLTLDNVALHLTGGSLGGVAGYVTIGGTTIFEKITVSGSIRNDSGDARFRGGIHGTSAIVSTLGDGSDVNVVLRDTTNNASIISAAPDGAESGALIVAGGLIGLAHHSFRIERGINNGAVSSIERAAGGLVGWAWRQNSQAAHFVIIDSKNTGAVSATGSAGGLIGLFGDENVAELLVRNNDITGSVLGQYSGGVFGGIASPYQSRVGDPIDYSTALSANRFGGALYGFCRNVTANQDIPARCP